MNFTNYAKNKLVYQYETPPHTKESDLYSDYERTWAQAMLRIGVVVKSRYELAVLYEYFGSFSTYINMSGRPRTLNVQLNYKF